MTNTTTVEPLKAQLGLTSEQRPPLSPLTEAATWLATQRDSCHLYGDLEDEGIIIDWHNFELDAESTLEWPRNVHSQCLELCLNLSGYGSICSADSRLNFEPLTAFLYAPANGELRAWRKPGERHRFLSINFSVSFLRDQLVVCDETLHPIVRNFVLRDGPVPSLGTSVRLTAEHERLISSLLRPQCAQGPCALRRKGIILQLMADLLVSPCCGNESPCDRQKCLALERSQKVMAILERDLADPPTLEEIGREVGCSPFYLSRTFSREMGVTIPQYLRTLRMRHAAGMLRSGRCNVTEAAMAVGYSSLSHFSQAFCQAIGCCPTMYSSSVPDQVSMACTACRSDVSAQNQRLSEGSGPEIDVLLETIR